MRLVSLSCVSFGLFSYIYSYAIVLVLSNAVLRMFDGVVVDGLVGVARATERKRDRISATRDHTVIDVLTEYILRGRRGKESESVSCTSCNVYVRPLNWLTETNIIDNNNKCSNNNNNKQQQQ